MSHFPVFGAKMFDKFVKSLQDKSFKLRPEWGFEPAQVTPIVSDTLVECLECGLIESVKGLKRITGDTKVELDDGKTVDVEVLIWCTGYKADFSMLESRFDPTTCPSPAWSSASGSNGKRRQCALPRSRFPDLRHVKHGDCSGLEGCIDTAVTSCYGEGGG